jgi:hypothetical protein
MYGLAVEGGRRDESTDEARCRAAADGVRVASGLVGEADVTALCLAISASGLSSPMVSVAAGEPLAGLKLRGEPLDVVD